jgi:hypothetical protein
VLGVDQARALSAGSMNMRRGRNRSSAISRSLRIFIVCGLATVAPGTSEADSDSDAGRAALDARPTPPSAVPPDLPGAGDAVDRMKNAHVTAVHSCGDLLRDALPEVRRWCPGAGIRPPGPYDMGSGQYDAADDQETCGFSVYISDSGIARSSWTAPARVRHLFSDKITERDGTHRSTFGFASVVTAGGGGARRRAALLALGKQLADTCAMRGDDGFHELALTFTGDRGPECLAGTTPVPRTIAIAVHERFGVLEPVDFNYLVLQREGARWTAQQSHTVEGEQFECPGGHGTCGTIYGYRTLRWSLSALAADGDGELTIIDEGRSGAPGCRRILPFHAALVAQ